MAIVFITGATSGFGRASALLFAKNGWDVIINGRRTERLDALEDEIHSLQQGSRVLKLPFDVRERQLVKESIEKLSDDWSRIDVLINNAGLASGLSFIHEGNIDDWETMIDTNVKGLLYVSRAIMPGMVERKTGHIINISSIAGKEAYPKGNVYCATKHAVDALTKSMRIDLLPFGIRVTSINPGAAETEFSIVRFGGDKQKADQVYKGYKPLMAEDVADVVFYAATRPPHVTLNDILITPLAQANTSNFHKENL
ncbi:MAG: SDR family NAD(P)-dependent oxidoreductase [Bacteroidota bacterium]